MKCRTVEYFPGNSLQFRIKCLLTPRACSGYSLNIFSRVLCPPLLLRPTVIDPPTTYHHLALPTLSPLQKNFLVLSGHTRQHVCSAPHNASILHKQSLFVNWRLNEDSLFCKVIHFLIFWPFLLKKSSFLCDILLSKRKMCFHSFNFLFCTYNL